MKKNTYRFAAALLAVSISCSLCACESKDANYRFGKDKIATITSVVGDRPITATEASDKNEFPTLQYTYHSDSVAEDLTQYTQLLQEQGWTPAGADYDLTSPPGTIQFVKASAETGWLLNIRITFEENQYTIRVAKVEATISQG